MYGIEEIKKLVLAGTSLGMVADKVFDDGKLSFDDLFYFDDLYSVVRDLMAIDYSLIPKELKNLDSNEISELSKFFQDKLDLGNDDIEVVLERAFDLALKIYGMISDAISFAKSYHKHS